MLGIPTRSIRILTQAIVFGIWVALILATKHPMEHWISRVLPVSLFLRLDPLVLTAVAGGMRVGITLLFLGFITLAVSLLLGRVFCGWVCPLGAIFDVYGWILRRLKVRTLGPSPQWFRLKYLILAAILVVALMGGVSPLMGLDPIVILTRTFATLIRPVWRVSDELLWAVGDPLKHHGHFVDLLTLLLFLGIMSATTRVSRIWCRTACPLGAYLAIASRHAVLRRETQDCIQCGICAANCPTGAIDFKDAKIYNESECIKCFTCSQECPVDANFFTLKSPLPAATPSYYPVSIERREVLLSVAAAAVSVPVMNLSSGNPGSAKILLRPPMSREERDFLTSCIRCSECITACPTGILKSSGTSHGLRALWSPIMVPTEGACLEGCNACSVACPTNAILKYPIEEKYSYKAGTAVFNSDRCISYTEDKFCSECVRVCPTNAIDLQVGWVPDPDAPVAVSPVTGRPRLIGGLGNEMPAPEGQKPTRPIHVSYDRCVGCGACEFACNQIVMGESAMKTTSYGRAVKTQGISPS
jgi:ferredoxin